MTMLNLRFHIRPIWCLSRIHSKRSHISNDIFFLLFAFSSLFLLDKFLPPVMKIYVCWMAEREPTWAWENNKRKKVRFSHATCHTWIVDMNGSISTVECRTEGCWSISNEKAYQKLNYKCLRKFSPILQLFESRCAVLCHHWSFRAKLNCFVEQEFVGFSSTPSSLSFTLVSLLHDSRFIYSTFISWFNFIT